MSSFFSSGEPTGGSANGKNRVVSDMADGNPAPPAASDAGAGFGRYFEVFHFPRFLNARSGYVMALFVMVIVCQTVAMVNMSKNSGPRPYFIEHDEKTGAVWTSSRVAEQYSASADNKRYFLRKWAGRFQTIEQDANHTLNVEQPAAYAWTMGTATKEFNEYFDKTDNVADLVAKYPGLSREVTETGTSFSPDGKTAFMILSRVWKVNGVEQAVGTHAAHDAILLRIDFMLLPQALDKMSAEDAKKERDDNPLVVRITHFTVAPYYGPGSAS